MFFGIFVFGPLQSFVVNVCTLCILGMVLSMFYRLVLANFLFSLRDMNLRLGPLAPPEDTWYGVTLCMLRVLGQGLDQSARIFFTRA